MSVFAAVNSSYWQGIGLVGQNSQQVAPLFPPSGSRSDLGAFTNATSVGATGTGTPTIAGSYPLTNGSHIHVWGEYDLSSWPAL